MNTTCEKIKKAFIIGVTAIMLLAVLPNNKNEANNPNSWFITGAFSFDDDTDNSGITVITDSEEDIEFSFGIVELFKRIFS